MRLRMRSVKSISQVTRALEAMSASRVVKAQQAALATRPYAAKAYEVLRHLASQPGSVVGEHSLLQRGEAVQQILVVLISSNRGLCGAYNTNLVRAAIGFMRDQTAPVQFVTVGGKGRDLLLRLRCQVMADFSSLPSLPSFTDVSPVGRLVINEFLSGRADQVWVAYTTYVNTLRQAPRILPLLPLHIERRKHGASQLPEGITERRQVGAEEGDAPIVYTYEPSQKEIVNVIVPRLVEMQIYQAILESLASEHSARMVAMRSATDNANELLDTLQLTYNKARQLSITSDLLDITGGVEALHSAEARESQALKLPLAAGG
jgi:F-type H+-transporting ATPase subunit gamma